VNREGVSAVGSVVFFGFRDAEDASSLEPTAANVAESDKPEAAAESNKSTI
jgi:hypothetical protein